MLVVRPASGMLPINDALAVLTTSILFVAISKASRVARFADVTIIVGDVPALISPPLTMVSYWPSMVNKPPAEVGLDALCEAKTRSVTWLADTVVPAPVP